MHPDGPESDSDLRRAQRRRERPPERSGDVSEGETQIDFSQEQDEGRIRFVCFTCFHGVSDPTDVV